MENSLDISKQALWQIMERVSDPEIPVLSVVDLGIIRDILVHPEWIEIVYTPTYSGCPAMDVIRGEIKKALEERGWHTVKLTQKLSPAWTTNWMTEEGKRKLRDFGIAPPVAGGPAPHPVSCPHCGSARTELLSQYGSTACKALYRCMDCLEPFDYFKCH